MRKLFTLFAAIILTTGMWGQSITVSIDNTSQFVPTSIKNGSFDDEPWMVFTFENETYYSCPHDRNLDTASDSKDNESGYAQNVVFNGVGGGWNTTERTLWRSSLFEITNSVDGKHNYQHNSSIPQTDKYVEMNNYHSCMLYQDLRTNSHDVIRWTLKHAVTTAGNEYQPIRVEIGAPNRDSNGNIVNASGWASSLNPQIVSSTKAIYHYDGVTDNDGKTSKIGFGSATDLQYLQLRNKEGYQKDGWWTAQGVYAIPEGQTVTRFGFISEADRKNQGNLLDNITFSTLIGNLSAQQLANHDVEVKGYWGETDPSKKFKVVIDGTVHEVNMSSVTGKNFRILIPAAIVGTATSVEAYHQDYQVAENTIAVTPVYSSTLQSGTGDAPHWTITPAVAEQGTTIDVTYSGSLRPATVFTTPTASTWTMEYTGTIQTFTAPATGVYELLVWGAQGGSFNNDKAGGLGGYAICRTNLTEGETIYIYVGGQGGTGTKGVGGNGGWNGGGAGGNGHPNYPSAGGGGGATHISKVNNQVIGNGSGQCASLVGTSFIIVAGGGGGGGWQSTTPGVGGGTEASKGTKIVSSNNYATYSDTYYYNVSQSYGANGGNAVQNQVYSCAAESAGGGGGGYYGGNAYCAYSNFPTSAYQNAAGCGGGSAYNSGLATNFSATAGVRSRNGKAEIRLVSVTGNPTLTPATKVGNNHWQYTIPNNNVEVVVEYHPWDGTGTEADPYQISSTADWNRLSDKVAAGKNYAGVYFRQTADISVTTPVGSFTDETHYKTFNGTYDGDGKTLSVTINQSGERYVAPFHYISGATIKNLVITGSVSVSGSGSEETYRHPAGLVGATEAGSTSLVENCRVSTNVSGSDYVGGIVGNALNSSLTIRGCVYSGTLTANSTNYAGGLLGWGGDGSGKTVSIVNSIFCGSYSGSGNFHPVGCYYDPAKHTRSVSNTYYTVAPNMSDDDGHSFVRNLSYKGKFAYRVTGGTGVTVSNAGTVTPYNISGITSYGTGILYDGVLYGGQGDEISLNLTHADPPVGHSFSHYSADNGTVTGSTNPYTLTMVNADAVVSANYSVNQYTITFNSNGGSAVDPITQDYNTTVVAPADPTRTAYTFAGWTPDVPSTMPAEDIELTAQWTPIDYTISYNMDGGTGNNPTTYTIETPTFTLEHPTKEFCLFAGWIGSNGDTPEMDVTIEQGSTGDKSYTATWGPAPIEINANQDPENPGTYYSTFYYGGAKYLIPDGVEAYAATIGETDLYLKKIAEAGDILPEGTAVILKSTVKPYTLTPSDEDAVVITENNDLDGVDVNTEIAAVVTGKCYVLSGRSADNSVTGVGFYLYQAPNQLKAHRAFVDVPIPANTSAPAPQQMRFVFYNEETTTNVETVESGESRVESQKILRDGQLIIIRGEREYNAQGQVIK